jgi:K319L-like, PKD domain/Kelch motif
MKTLLAGIYLFLTLLVVSCKKEKSCENCRETNKLPTANAGLDQIITLPTDSVVLDGRSSSDPDGRISSYLWSKISGPASFTILHSSDSITKVKNLVKGVYLFELKVTDNGNLSAKDTVQITVNDATQVNRPPVANAEPDQIITLPTNTVSLDGSNSTDPDNNITSYVWTKISGPSLFNITTANVLQTQVTNLVEGIYQFELKVTDAGGLFSKDTVLVSVNGAIAVSPCDNRPIVNANLVQIGTLSEARFDLVSATVNNKIFFAGGQSARGYSSRVDIYDIATNTWSATELSNGNRMGMAVATVGNKVLFAGGMENDNGIQTSRVDIYDASTNSWSQAELSQPRAYLAAATAGNKVLFAGGGFWNPYFTGSSVVDIYDNATNTWTT